MPITWTPANSCPFCRTTVSISLVCITSTMKSCEIESDETRRHIARAHTKSGRCLAGDLFIDCSGFSSLLIGKHFGVPFLSQKDVLFIDKAWAVQVPYPR